MRGSLFALVSSVANDSLCVCAAEPTTSSAGDVPPISGTENTSSKSVNWDRRFTFAEFLELAEKQGNELSEQVAKVQFSEARESFAHSYGWPAGKLEMFAGPNPGASGNAVDGKTNWNRWGVFTGAKIELAQPLYTFGAIGAGIEAAEAGTRAERALYQKNRQALRTQVAEFYYGYQAAFEFSELASNIESKLQEALKAGQKLRERGKKGAPSETDLDKLRVYLGEIQVRMGEADKGMKLARAAMAWKLGVYGRIEPKWDRANLALRAVELKTLKDYQEAAREVRPESLALKEDVAAKSALVRVEEGLTLPAFFVAGQANYMHATERQTQNSPYAYDPLNDLSAGLVLGLRWNLGFFERQSRLAQARAELAQAQARQRHFEAGIQADVERSYLDLKQLSEAAGLRDQASRSAKRVYQDSTVAFALGTGSAKDLLESLGTFATTEKSRLETLYLHNVAISKLEQSVGRAL